jgi:outer membrane lipoprotein-sorting protein
MRRLACLLLLAGCPGPSGHDVHGPDTTPTDAIQHLAGAREAVKTFRADSTMDYRFGDQRVKGEVIVIGQPGQKVRLNALSPMGGDVMADLACDGTTFYYRDKQHDCEMTGPCTADTIAQLLHVQLEPDDFLYLAAGTPPVIAGSADMAWDSKAGQENVTVHGAQGTETIALDDKRDVLRAELEGPDGKHVWTVENKDFTDIDGGHRVPGKTRFQTEERDNDLIVDWTKIEENVELPDGKFKFDLIGLPTCGQKHP